MMADAGDLAQILEERALAAWRRQATREIERLQAVATALPAEPVCADCGDDIPPERMAALGNPETCAPCQGRRELLARRR